MIQRIVLVLFLYCGLVINVNSQTKNKGELSFKSGVSLSQQSYVNSFYTFNKTHLPRQHLPSLFLNIQYKPSLRIGKLNVFVDAFLFEKGFKTNFANNTQYNQSYSYNLNYFDLQLDVGYKLSRLSLMLGMNVSYLIRARQYFYEKDWKVSSNRIFESNFVQDYTDRFHRWDWGINYTFAYKINKQFCIEGSVHKSFNRIDKLKQYEVIYNQLLTLGLRYKVF
jgi:hypothetical protein